MARDGEQSFRLLVESIRDYAICLLDTHGYVATWNEGAQRLTGYRPEEIIGRHVSAFYLPGTSERVLAEAARDERAEEEGWCVRKDGSTFWGSTAISAVRDGEGRLIGFAKVTRDLTERRKQEQRVFDSERRFRLFVDGVQDYAIWMLDPDGRVVSWNQGARRIEGYDEGEILGHHLSQFYVQDGTAEARAAHELETARRDGRFQEEGWQTRKDGTRFWAFVILTALRSEDGEVIGFAKVTRDLTARVDADAERRRRAHAEEAVRMRDEFLAVASHELKTPLTALQLELEALRTRLASIDAGSAERLARAVRSGERLRVLVESLLDVSRFTSCRFELRRDPLDLRELVAQTVERMQAAASAAGSELTFRAEGPLLGSWDRLRVEQVVMNLVSNAIKYGAGRPVVVALAPRADGAAIEVSDRGPGIAERDLARIFERFERAASLRHYGGLGLGLFVTREIAEAHGGVVTVRNLPEGGSCFTVTLPG